MRDAFAGYIDLDPRLKEPLYLQLTRQLKAAILSGKLQRNTSLPSSRAMALDLGVSRNTVIEALDQLKAEGYIDSRPGSGMHVAPFEKPDFGRGAARLGERASFKHALASRWERAIESDRLTSPDMPRPFRPGLPDVRAFPYDAWNASLRRAAHAQDRLTAGYAHLSGHPRFREILAGHLAETRGVIADPDQIIVTSSARGAMSLIAHAFLENGDTVWLEEPGFAAPKIIFAAAGAKLVPIPVDEFGITLKNAAPLPNPRLIYTTPSHQYPAGMMMGLSRRLELLDFAVRANAYILEDDYDSEFQYRGRPIAALQGLDQHGCVLYLGTFSKSLLPGFRLGFVVVPKCLAQKLAQVHRYTGQLVPPLMQLAVADFIGSGRYRAHVRRMRSLYSQRLECFVELIEKNSGGRLEARCPKGGMQTVVSSKEGLGDRCLAERFATMGIECSPLCDFHLEPDKAGHKGVLMGISAWSEIEMRDALKLIGPHFFI